MQTHKHYENVKVSVFFYIIDAIKRNICKRSCTQIRHVVWLTFANTLSTDKPIPAPWAGATAVMSTVSWCMSLWRDSIHLQYILLPFQKPQCANEICSPRLCKHCPCVSNWKCMRMKKEWWICVCFYCTSIFMRTNWSCPLNAILGGLRLMLKLGLVKGECYG